MAGVLGAGRNRVRGRERRRKKQAGGKSMQEKGLRMRPDVCMGERGR